MCAQVLYALVVSLHSIHDRIDCVRNALFDHLLQDWTECLDLERPSVGLLFLFASSSLGLNRLYLCAFFVVEAVRRLVELDHKFVF